MVNWTELDADLANYFRSKSAKNVGEAAKFIATVYNDAVRTAELLNGNMLLNFANERFEQALTDAFTTMLNGGDYSMTQYRQIADALVSAWAMSTFDDKPFPGTEKPSKGVEITFGGAIDPLAEGLYKAFNSQEEQKVVDNLKKAFLDHLKTIAGTYSGKKTVDKALVDAPIIDWIGVV